MMGKIDNVIIEAITKRIVNEVKYYHGTPDRTAADNISSNGLGNSSSLKPNGGDSNGFESAPNRQYLTKSVGNATRYATMMNGDDAQEDGYVLEFDVDDDVELGVDEDEIGSIIYKYLNGNGQLPFRKSLLSKLTQQELRQIGNGEFSGYAACKKLIDSLTDEEIKQTLSVCNNATVSKHIKPTACHSVRRPSQDEKTKLFKAKDFQPYDEYFTRNSKTI